MKNVSTVVAWVFLVIGAIFLLLGIEALIAAIRNRSDMGPQAIVMIAFFCAVPTIWYPLAYLREKTKRRAYSLADFTGVSIWMVTNAWAWQVLHKDSPDTFSPRWLAGVVIPIIIAVSANAIFKNLIDASYKKSDHGGPSRNGDAATSVVNAEAAEEPPSTG